MEYLEVRRLLSAAVTSTTLKVSPSPALYGQDVTLTAEVTAKSGSPSGIVTFLDAAATLGAVAINTTTHKAALSMPLLTLGINSLTAVYGGATVFDASTSLVVHDTVNPVPTTTTLVSSSNPATAGQTLTFTATVADKVGSPVGTVTFLEGITTLGTAVVNTLSNQVTFTTSTLAVGTNSLTAVYGGTTGFAASTSSAVKEKIKAIPTQTILVPAANPGTAGQVLTLTAVVTSSDGSPGGTVVFKQGANTLGTAAVNTTTNEATFTTSSLALGTNSLTATYKGSAGFSASNSAAVKEAIVAAPIATTTTLATSSNPGTLGQTITFTATITPTSGATAPGGTVTFLYGATTLGTAAVSTSTHEAFITTSSLPFGMDSITAVYGGTKGFTASTTSEALNETINTNGPQTTYTALASSLNPATSGQEITLTAIVSSPLGTPSGSVTFFNGNTVLGTAALNTLTHKASLATSALTVGTGDPTAVYDITAVYGGVTGSFITSTSIDLPETIFPVPVATTTTLVSSLTPALAGEGVTLTATVTANGGSPVGTVTFEDGNVPIGTTTVNAETGVATLITSSLAVGTNSLTADYTGTVGFAPSTSSAVSEVVTQVTTTTTLTASPSNTTIGQVVTFTADVVPEAGGATPIGDVTFVSGEETLGTVALNSSGIATMTAFTGAYTVEAIYTGNTTDAGSNGSVTLTAPLPALTTLTSGTLTMQYAILNTGSGAAAQTGQYVQVNYTGYLTTGTIFDSSLDPGRTPFDFGLGEGSVIEGWDAGIPGMLVGETRLLVIPSNGGYGTTGQGTIPPNAELIFVVQMLAVDLPRVGITNQGNSVAVTNGEAASSDAGTLFPSTAIGSSSPSESFELQSLDSSFSLQLTGTPQVQVTGADASDFVVSQPSSGVFTITFTPTATGTLTAVLSIQTNDPDVPDFTFDLSGTGT